MLTNYQFWMHARARNKSALEKRGGQEPVGLLICDEAHKAMDALALFLKTWVSNEMLHTYANEKVRGLVRAAEGKDWGRVTPDWVDALELVVVGRRSSHKTIGRRGRRIGSVRSSGSWRRCGQGWIR